MVFMTEWNGDIIEQHPPASHLVGEHALWNTFRLTGGHIDSTLPTKTHCTLFCLGWLRAISAVQPTHCVVDFTEENNFSLVPVKKLNIPVASTEAGCDCRVEWGKKKQLFKTAVTGLGMFSAMASSILVKFIPSDHELR